MSERSPERRRPSLNIEGEPIQAMEEVEIERAQPLDLPDSIVWPGSRLEFVPLSQSYVVQQSFEEVTFPLYLGRLVFQDPHGINQTVDLSNETTGRPTVFTGSRSGFFAHDPRSASRLEPFLVVGLEPGTLALDQRRLVSLYHELGHAGIFDGSEDVQLLQSAVQEQPEVSPQRVGSLAYFEELTTVLPPELKRVLSTTDINPAILSQANRDDRLVARSVALFHERYAWAAAFAFAQRTGAPLGVQKPASALAYAKFCLSTYARHYGDQRFVTGLGKSKT